MSETPKTTESRFFLWRLLGVLEKIFCVVPVAVMTALVFVAVICRYVFKSPIGWTEEVTLICLTWCVFGAASYAFYSGINVGVTFLVDRIGGKNNHKAKHIVNIVINLATIVFFVILLYTSSMTLANVVGKYSMAAHIPLVIPYSALPVGCAMSILRLIEMILDDAKMMRSGAEKETVTE
ncbi:Tripartite ATP-independent transporter, DctQ component [Oscillibacter sp. PC13]|uniref:TRAP transporter small permease n=1 Tax=Oscillibacter sp. PC13 TaxID=1855299 RepID=UPI0008E6E11B|nr:TRAP transporter small permease [Oscillibacter sp. PC13]SFQ18679.1 Tripartite ATP-independent transporter, DctQ component [Oscillibacter sp. PC13]